MTRRSDANMSDSEDLAILDEIRALDDLLSPEKDDSGAICSRKSADNIDGTKEVLQAQQNIDTSNDTLDSRQDDKFETCHAAFEYNKKLINCLQVAKEDIMSILKECDEKLEIIEGRLQEHSKHSIKGGKSILCIVGMPYFKDKSFFPAPRNDDAKLKASRNELSATSIGNVCRWTPKDRKILLRAIREEAILQVLNSSGVDHNSLNSDVSSRKEVANNFLPRDFREMVSSLKCRDFDWMKIAAADFDRRHSADECRVMWNVYLHPDINKNKWTKQEVSKLNKIADRYKYQNWDNIARDLDTRRSGYQCFIKYNSSRQDVLSCNEPWTAKEDKKLLNLINKFAIGDFIPWGEVAKYQKGRLKHQVYARWMYSLAPHLKKGRFTKEEDDILLSAVEKFGRDFKKISVAVLPQRTSAQLCDHYKTLVSKGSKWVPWEIEDDVKLLKLHDNLGAQWTKIAKHFTSRDRTQVRHRYAALQKKGFFADFNTSGRVKKTEKLDDVDKQLLEYFRFVPYNIPGRKQNLYNPQELENNTTNLYNVLSILNAELHIPDDLSNLQLTQKDKQLLYSLKEYHKMLIHKARNIDEGFIEQVRLKMFGSLSNLEESEKYIPTSSIVPSVVGSKRRKAMDNKANNGSNHTIDLQMEFETPDCVINLIGGFQKHLEFEKISLLLQRDSTRHCTRVMSNILQQNIHEPLQLDSSDINNSINRFGFVSDKSIPSTSTFNERERHVFTNQDDKRTKSSLPSALCSGSTTTLRFPINQYFVNIQSNTLLPDAIAPTYSTVIGYQNLHFWMEQKLTEADSHQKNFDIYGGETTKSREAFKLLEERLLRLFKFPMGMTEIFAPQIPDNDTSCIFDEEDTESKVKRRKQCTKRNNKNKAIKKITCTSR